MLIVRQLVVYPGNVTYFPFVISRHCLSRGKKTRDVHLIQEGDEYNPGSRKGKKEEWMRNSLECRPSADVLLSGSHVPLGNEEPSRRVLTVLYNPPLEYRSLVIVFD